MGITVPTLEEFHALEARVTALEAAAQPQPPEPTPPPDTAIEGAQAKRIADVIELFGVNTFSSLDEHNLWGSWPADYRPESVIAALKWLAGDAGFALPIREYHYAGRESFQQPWINQIKAAIPDTEFTFCVGANGSVTDVETMLALQGVTWFEGLNEPNTDFGSGMVPKQTTLEIQNALWQRRHHGVMGPSIVAGMPHPEGWITGYCEQTLPALNSMMEWGNGHYYPPGCPDLAGSGTSLAEYLGGLATAYAQHPIALTEFHPTLYNAAGNKPDQPGWSGERDAYYTLLALLRAAKCTIAGLWWYALFDYGATYRCGLFPQHGPDNPRLAATALRNLCSIVADRGPERRTFAPGKLAVSVDGLPGDADWDLYQASTGRFFVALWRSAAEPGGESMPITVSFDAAQASVTEFDPLANAEAARTWHDEASVTVSLDAGVRILAVETAATGRRSASPPRAGGRGRRG